MADRGVPRFPDLDVETLSLVPAAGGGLSVRAGVVSGQLVVVVHDRRRWQLAVARDVEQIGRTQVGAGRAEPAPSRGVWGRRRQWCVAVVCGSRVDSVAIVRRGRRLPVPLVTVGSAMVGAAVVRAVPGLRVVAVDASGAPVSDLMMAESGPRLWPRLGMPRRFAPYHPAGRGAA
ncbi:hypothetical protein NUM_06770 [Actinocatenispora comari]|uniref:Uncharacterized protein n=1 Tax=Actinocatenispora comari TaxID=2807577 RepID=A0A8J4A970_9ACTN|nr:hypothetical protein NUM_06770 [Actinocatenispora comari]